mmetsp:Transcript_10377/g.10244  ORF Transcript_10377/g.10244 Transcript_10377/m.10244 type:complete len:101 (-) Transcript_10377:624-926(-)
MLVNLKDFDELGEFNFKYVFFVAFKRAEQGVPKSILSLACQEIIKICRKEKIKSVTLPTIGCGVLRTPISRCSQAMSEGFALSRELVKDMTDINIVCYED